MATEKKNTKSLFTSINFLLLVLVIILSVGIIATKKYNLTKQIAEVIQESEVGNAKEYVSPNFDSETRLYSSPEIKKPLGNGVVGLTDTTYRFTLQLADGWEIIEESYVWENIHSPSLAKVIDGKSVIEAGYRLKIEKNGYALLLRDGFGAPDICVFDGKIPQDIDRNSTAVINYSEYLTMNTKYTRFRIGTKYRNGRKGDGIESDGFNFCTYNANTNQWETSGSIIGTISLTVPSDYSLTEVNEAISILETLTYSEIE